MSHHRCKVAKSTWLVALASAPGRVRSTGGMPVPPNAVPPHRETGRVEVDGVLVVSPRPGAASGGADKAARRPCGRLCSNYRARLAPRARGRPAGSWRCRVESVLGYSPPPIDLFAAKEGSRSLTEQAPSLGAVGVREQDSWDGERIRNSEYGIRNDE